MPRARRKQILSSSFRNKPIQRRSKSHNDTPESSEMRNSDAVEESGFSTIKAGPPNRDTHRRIAECRQEFDKLVRNDEQSKIFKEMCSCVKEAAIKAMAALEMCAESQERVEPHLSKLSIDAMATFSRGAGRINGYGNMSLLQRWTHQKSKVKERLLAVARQLELIAEDAWDLADGIPLAKRHRDIRLSVGADMNFSLVRKRIYKSPKNKIRQLIFAPTRGGADGTKEGRVVLWSVDGCLYRHDIPSGVTTSISTKVVGSPVLCMTVDNQYRIWTGHRGGLTKCWSEHSEAVLAEAQCMGADIRAIVTTSSGIAWIGCQLGAIARLKCHESERGLWIENLGAVAVTTANKQLNSSLAVDLLESVKRAYSGMTDMLAHMGRVRCMLARDDSVWSSGGDQRSSSSLRVWNAAGEETCVKNLSAFGACDAMFDLAWDEKAFPEEDCLWRLLTGHETGELVLWMPMSLIPMVKIGPRAPPVRSIFVMDYLGLLFTAHQDGSIRFRSMIVPDNGAPGLFSSSHSCSCVADERLHKHLPPFGEFKAHRSRLTHAVGAIDNLVSASSRGTVSCWPVSVLEQEALKAGIQVLYRTNSRSLKRDKTVKWLNRPILSGGDSKFNASVTVDSETSSVDDDFQGNSSSNHDGEYWNQYDSQELDPDSSVEKPALSLEGSELPSINLDQGAWDLECKTATLLGGRTSVARLEDEDEETVVVEKPRSRAGDRSRAGSYSSFIKSPFVDVMTPFDSPRSLSNQELKTMFSQGVSGELIRQSSGECSVSRDVSAEQIIIDAEDLQFDQDPRKSLGAGAFGVVYKGKAFMMDAAIKVLKHSSLLDEASQSLDINKMDVTDIDVDEDVDVDEREHETSSEWQDLGGKPLRALVREAGLMLQLRHPHIVLFLGVCLDPPALVTEYCGKGSLFTLLQKANAGVEQAKNSLTWHRILTMAHEAALGVHYLHRHHVEHRDLKSLNLLVDEHLRIKVADFGTSKFMLNEKKWSDSVHATNPRWLPPEAMKSNTYGFKADVYAFGIVLWELLTWRMPWESDSGDRPCHPLQLFKWVMEGLRPDTPDPENLPAGPCPVYDEYIALMKICWAQEPAERPHFDTITKCLEDMLAKISEPKEDEKRRPVLVTSPSYAPSQGGQQSPRDASSPRPPPSSPFGAMSPRQAPTSPFYSPRRPESPFARPATPGPVSSVGGDSVTAVPPPTSPQAPLSPRQPPSSPFSYPNNPFSYSAPSVASLEGASRSGIGDDADTSPKPLPPPSQPVAPAQGASSPRPPSSPFGSTAAQSFVRKGSGANEAEVNPLDPRNSLPPASAGAKSAPMEIERLPAKNGNGGEEQNPPRSSWSMQDSRVGCNDDPPCDPDVNVPSEQGAVSDQELSLVLSRIIGETKNRREALKRVSDALRLFEESQSQEKGLEGPMDNLEKCSAQQLWCKEGELT
ncbi:hypothetical protein BSKO_10596 [Bryopsis sp. KO-2023]|nr:hypothetical protein BSKO_10596 [Bryopsis sp. KO-2023]